MSEPIVEVAGLWKTFGEVSAVEDLTFTVERGQVYGLLGPNGAGKTTTLRVLMGLERATGGGGRLFGAPATPDASSWRVSEPWWSRLRSSRTSPVCGT
jgi:ABC-2 type transport system ATP-binding protein